MQSSLHSGCILIADETIKVLTFGRRIQQSLIDCLWHMVIIVTVPTACKPNGQRLTAHVILHRPYSTQEKTGQTRLKPCALSSYLRQIFQRPTFSAIFIFIAGLF